MKVFVLGFVVPVYADLGFVGEIVDTCVTSSYRSYFILFVFVVCHAWLCL